tara:strand:+ start:209 stop:895 length:687 start_codon:yes stop_codon:yes gene_type:complete
MWRANVITLLPEAYPGLLGMSVIGNALATKVWNLNIINFRDFSQKNGKVDDVPFGGGPGMVIKPEIVDAAISSVQDYNLPKYYLSPRGEKFDQNMALKMSKQKGGIFICGRYEGIDERVIQYHQLKEISIGDYVVSGGDLALMVMLDTTIRLLPKVIGNEDALKEESFNSNLLEYPLYTQPRKWKNIEVPNVLVSGNHNKIKDWKIRQAESITKERRPDLWKKYLKSK